MRIPLLILGIIIFGLQAYGSFFAVAATGYPSNWMNLMPVGIVILLSLVGIIGMIKLLKAGAKFFIFAILCIGIPAFFWLHSMWPGGGILELLGLN
jgi:hypothetical protein